MKRFWDWLRWNQDAQFGIGAFIAFLIIAFFLLMLTSCATLTEPMIFPEQIAPPKEQQELCAVIYDSVRWLMARAGFCSGWDRT